MYPRNAASPERIAIGAVVQISDGAVQTSGVAITVTPQGQAASAGGNSPTYEEGIVSYVPTQAETNYTSFYLVAYKTGCIPAAITVVTSAAATAGQVVTDATSRTASQANVSDLATLVGRLTATRAGYLDKLNVSGMLAHSDAAASYKATGFAVPGDEMAMSVAERILLAAAIEAAIIDDLDGQPVIQAIADLIANDMTTGDLSVAAIATASRNLLQAVADDFKADVSGLATTANQTTILDRLGSITGSGVNTVLGFFKALLSKTASTPSDIGGTFDPADDSTEAIRDQGDSAWLTGAGGSSPTAEQISDYIDANSTKLGRIITATETDIPATLSGMGGVGTTYEATSLADVRTMIGFYDDSEAEYVPGLAGSGDTVKIELTGTQDLSVGDNTLIATAGVTICGPGSGLLKFEKGRLYCDGGDTATRPLTLIGFTWDMAGVDGIEQGVDAFDAFYSSIAGVKIGRTDTVFVDCEFTNSATGTTNNANILAVIDDGTGLTAEFARCGFHTAVRDCITLQSEGGATGRKSIATFTDCDGSLPGTGASDQPVTAHGSWVFRINGGHWRGNPDGANVAMAVGGSTAYGDVYGAKIWGDVAGVRRLVGCTIDLQSTGNITDVPTATNEFTVENCTILNPKTGDADNIIEPQTTGSHADRHVTIRNVRVVGEGGATAIGTASGWKGTWELDRLRAEGCRRGPDFRSTHADHGGGVILDCRIDVTDSSWLVAADKLNGSRGNLVSTAAWVDGEQLGDTDVLDPDWAAKEQKPKALESGVILSATGLDLIPLTAPIGPATTLSQIFVKIYRRFYGKVEATGEYIKTYQEDGTTTATTQTVSDDGTTQTQGEAS